MSNAMRRVANYLGLMDDPEFDTPQTSTTNAPAVPATGDVRIKTREPRSVSAVRHSTVVEVVPIPNDNTKLILTIFAVELGKTRFGGIVY